MTMGSTILPTTPFPPFTLLTLLQPQDGHYGNQGWYEIYINMSMMRRGGSVKSRTCGGRESWGGR